MTLSVEDQAVVDAAEKAFVQDRYCGISISSGEALDIAYSLLQIITTQAEEVERLRDPVAVHANMLRGTIATPDIRSLLHLHGAEALAKWDRAETAEADRDAHKHELACVENNDALIARLREDSISRDREIEAHGATFQQLATAEATVARLTEALKPLAAIPFEEFAGNGKRPNDTPLMAWNGVQLTIGHVRAARKALHPEEQS